MEYKIIVDEKLGVITCVSTGDWTIEESNLLTKEIVDVSRKHNIRRALIDHRKLKINISRYFAFKRPDELKSHFEDVNARVAFVSAKRRHKIYQFFAMVAQNRGLQFHAFKKQDEAMEWLIKDN